MVTLCHYSYLITKFYIILSKNYISKTFGLTGRPIYPNSLP